MNTHMSCSFAFKKKRLSIFSLLASILLHNGKPMIPQHGHAQLTTKLIKILVSYYICYRRLPCDGNCNCSPHEKICKKEKRHDFAFISILYVEKIAHLAQNWLSAFMFN